MIGRLSLIVTAIAFIFVHGQRPDSNGSIDIGTVGLVGSSMGSGSDWSVSGAGSDIWGGEDHFHYLYWNQTGNLTVTVRIKEFTCEGCSHWRKAGIMIRGDAGARDPHSMLQLTGWGIANQFRQSLNGYSDGHHDSYSTENVWLRLVKSGNTITSFVKRDGEYGFMQYHSVEVNLPDKFLVGLAVTSHDVGVLGTIEVSDFEISNEVFSIPASPSDIGDTGQDVQVRQTGQDIWSINAAGTGIGGTSDSFGFFDNVYSGDLTATLHLEKLTRRDADTKGGLMMRASHDVGSPHVSLLVRSNNGICMVWRSAAGGNTEIKGVGVWEEDMELKLEKTGDSVACSYKHVSAPNWFVIGTAIAEFGATVHVGPAVSSAIRGSHAQLKTGVVNVVPSTIV